MEKEKNTPESVVPENQKQAPLVDADNIASKSQFGFEERSKTSVVPSSSFGFGEGDRSGGSDLF